MIASSPIAMLRAYNDWHIDDWCGRHPGRFIPLALPPIWDPEEMATRGAARRRARAATPSPSPTTPAHSATRACTTRTGIRSGRPAPTRATVVCIHIGSGTRHEPAGRDGAGRDHDRRHADHAVQLRHRARLLGDLQEVSDASRSRCPRAGSAGSRTSWSASTTCTSTITAGRCTRFPNGKKPSDVFREHIITCFIDDAAGVRNRDLIGIDNITWECDYPHSRLDLAAGARDAVGLARRRARRRDPQDHLAERHPALPLRPLQAHPEGAVHASARCARRRRTST